MYQPPRIRAASLRRVLLADDQAIFRAGTARVLDNQEDITVLGQCDGLTGLLELVATTRACVLVLAQSLGADLDRILGMTHAVATRVILMTDSSTKPPPALLRRLDGLLTRQTTAAELLACVRDVSNGERVLNNSTEAQDTVGDRMRELLSSRELQIIGFIVQGCKNRQIAGEIGTTEQVVKNYLRSIYDKTGSSDRLELALFTLHHRTLAEAAARAAETVPMRSAQA